MPIFELQTPDGKTYEVDAPDANAAASAIDQIGSAKERVDKERAGSPTFMAIDDTVRSISRGIPLAGGAMDEISAGLNTGFGYLGDYDKELQYQRERDRQYDEQHPYLSTAGQVGGAILGTLAAGRYMPGAVLPASMPGKIAAGAGAGTVMGGVEGFTRGEGGLANRAASAKDSAMWGGGIGFAGPIAARGVGAAWNAIASWLANRGVDAKAANKIVQELQGSGMSPQQAQQRLNELGPQGMIADVNPGMQQMAGATGISDPGAARIITERLATRREGGHGRVAQALNNAFGPPQDPYTMQQGTRGIQRGTGAAYQSAGQYVVDMEPAANYLFQQIQRVGPNGPLGEALQRIRGLITDQAGNLVNRGDRVHAIREQLDMMIEQARTSGQGKLAGALGNVRRHVDSALKQGVPGFAEADRTWSSAQGVQDAFEQGRTEVLRGGSNTMSPVQLRALQYQSPAPENVARMQGVRTELDRVMSNQRRDPAATIDRVTTRDWNDQKIANMVGNQNAQRLGRDLDREATFTQTSNLAEAGRGSRTAPLSATAQRLYGNGGGGAVSDMVTAGGAGTLIGGPAAGAAATAATGVNSLFRSLGNRLSRTAPQVINSIADRLTLTGQQRDAFMQQVARIVAQLPARRQTAQAIEDAANRLLVPQAGLLGYASSGRAGR